jgi:hypothetical protein
LFRLYLPLTQPQLPSQYQLTMIVITRTPWQPITIHQLKSVINQSDIPKGFKNENSAKIQTARKFKQRENSNSAKIQTFQLSDEGSKY